MSVDIIFRRDSGGFRDSRSSLQRRHSVTTRSSTSTRSSQGCDSYFTRRILRWTHYFGWPYPLSQNRFAVQPHASANNEGKLVPFMGFVACQLRPFFPHNLEIRYSDGGTLGRTLLGGNASHFAISHIGGHGRNLSRMHADSAPGSSNMEKPSG